MRIAGLYALVYLATIRTSSAALPQQSSQLTRRDDAVCNSDFAAQCKDAVCIPLNNDTSFICCNAGEICDEIQTITCPDRADKPAQCGNQCCPAGFSCSDSEDRCEMQEENLPQSYKDKRESDKNNTTAATEKCRDFLSATDSSYGKCPDFPAKAVVLGFFPGLLAGVAIMLIFMKTTAIRQKRRRTIMSFGRLSSAEVLGDEKIRTSTTQSVEVIPRISVPRPRQSIAFGYSVRSEGNISQATSSQTMFQNPAGLQTPPNFSPNLGPTVGPNRARSRSRSRESNKASPGQSLDSPPVHQAHSHTPSATDSEILSFVRGHSPKGSVTTAKSEALSERLPFRGRSPQRETTGTGFESVLSTSLGTPFGLDGREKTISPNRLNVQGMFIAGPQTSDEGDGMGGRI